MEQKTETTEAEVKDTHTVVHEIHHEPHHEPLRIMTATSALLIAAPAKTAAVLAAEQRKLQKTKTSANDAAKATRCKSLKILFCISEAQPFVATGGLGEVGGSLPRAIGSMADIRVILPLYSTISSELRKKFTFLGAIDIDFAWRKEYMGIFTYKTNNVTYYFVDNEKYFKRDRIYGYDDDGERFAYFSKAIIDSAQITGFRPDIVHANDWHTALSIVYLKTAYAEVKEFAKTRTLFTIHNMNYQGKYPYDFFNILCLDYKFKNLLEYDGQINLVKGAIECSDMFSTVSPSYAEEMKSLRFAVGLEICINNNAQKLVGILNGIDYKYYNPKADKELFAQYDKKTVSGKAVNKHEVQKLFQMQTDTSIPMLLYNGRLVEQKGIDLIKDGIDAIMQQRIQMIVMGNGEKRYESFFDHIESKYQGKFKALRYSNNLSKKLYAAADMVLMPSAFEPCGLCQMIASRYGTIPIVHETGGLKDSIRDFGCEGGGNGYTFRDYSTHDMLYSIRRVITDFDNDGKPWKDKIITCMNKDFSWKSAVNEYLALYRKIKKGK